MRKRLVIHVIAIIGIAVLAFLAIASASVPTTIEDRYDPSKTDWDNAIAVFTEVVEKNPNSATAYNALGVAYYYKGNYALAIANFEAAMRLNSDYSAASYNLARARQAAGPSIARSSGGQAQAAPASPAPVAVSSEDDFDIRQNTSGTITITGYHGTARNIVIPEKIEGVLVTEIGRNAFAKSSYISAGGFTVFSPTKEGAITSVIIPDSVTTIGDEAFLGNLLTSVNIPNSVRTIGNRAFANGQITSVTISNSISIIAHATFAHNQLTSVIIPDSVTTIGTEAFANNKLTSITIPNRVTAIGNDAFHGNQLTSVNIGSRVTTIGFGAFADNQLTSVIIPNSVTIFTGNTRTDQTGAFANNRLTSIVIPNSVTSVGEETFANNQLTSVTIMNSATTFRITITGPFDNNPITSITLPANADSAANVFPNSFKAFYESQGKRAGTYTWSGRIWRVE